MHVVAGVLFRVAFRALEIVMVWLLCLYSSVHLTLSHSYILLLSYWSVVL